MALSDEDKKEIEEMQNKAVHGALTEFGRKQADARKKDLEAGLAEFGGKLMEQVSALIPKQPPAPTPQPGGKQLDAESEARLKQAEAVAQKAAKDAERAQKLADEERAKREIAERQARQQEERQLLQEAMVAGKVRPGVIPMALGHLHSRIEREKLDDGSYGPPKFKDNDGVLVPIAKGVAEYLKSPEGQELMPARNAGGAGSGKPGAAGAGGSEEAGFADLAQHVGFSGNRE